MRLTPASLGRSARRLSDLAPEPVIEHPAPKPATVARRHDAAEYGFGPHLVFDGFGCALERLVDLDGLYQLLDRLPDRIGMTKIMPPYVFRHGKRGDAAEGLSGFVLIAESHISLHTFPGRRYANADIFSCESFEVDDALFALKEAFAPQRVEWKLLDRGREFPKHIAASRAIVACDRRLVARELGLEASR